MPYKLKETHMNTKTMPEIGTKVRALYIPSVTDRDTGKARSMTYPDFDYLSQEVIVTKIGTTTTENLASEDMVSGQDVIYARFETPHGSFSEFYFTDWVVVDTTTDTATDPVPELTPEQAEIKGLNERIANLLNNQRAVYAAMRQVNEVANEAASEQKYCSQYEDMLETLNGHISDLASDWDFRFQGRMVDYTVRVCRSVLVNEWTDVTVKAAPGADVHDLEIEALEAASSDWNWEEIDRDEQESYIESYNQD